MKSSDKLTSEQVVKHAVTYSRRYKCDLIVFECKSCGADFMLKQKADKSGIKGIIITYGKKEITATYEDKTVKKFETVLEKEEKPVKKKVVKKEKVDDQNKTEGQPEEVQDKDEQL